MAAAVLVGLPAAAVVAQALFGGGASADAAGQKLLIESALGLLALLILGGGGALAIGAAAAWAVSFCDFPGRRAFEWLLVLPLAAPAYVLAYAWGGLAGPAGVMPFTLSGTGAAAFVYAFAFYPYVYLAARASFATQSVCALEAARSLGASPWASFWRVALPLARPGLIAGGALALMEIAADYGAAAYFGAETMTTGVFHAWFARGDRPLALHLASALLLSAFALLALERRARSAGGVAGGSARWRPLPRYRLSPPMAFAALCFCVVLVGLGAVAPFGYLAWLASLRPAADWAALGAPLATAAALRISTE
jgi:iron(III) transport system permease protein